MPQYVLDYSEQPAPVGLVTFHRLDDENVAVSDVRMLLDAGADATLVPRYVAERLNVTLADSTTKGVRLSGYDATESGTIVTRLRMDFNGKKFRGDYAVTDSEVGIIGRSILNRFRLVFDGPRQTWEEAK
ncbi:MAG: hypothetical protein H7Y38_06405 [Armatimonadetes bacterium]|nr:hypothetical protein [Armatimonadota bacterium]